jgi:Gas vesicle synthesis protein GvpL/GvpF
VLYLYAFAAAPVPAPDVVGIDGAPVRAELLDGLAAVVSEHDAVEPSEEAVLAHARVVEAIAATNDAVLPARFGGLHRDEQALRQAVAGRRELVDALERVRGCVELGVRVFGDPAPPGAAASGAAYMRGRLERRRALDGLAQELHQPLAGLCRDSTVVVGATPRLLLTAAYLIERGQVEVFRAALETLETRHPDLGVVCTGPWPPYSFAIVEGAGL